MLCICGKSIYKIHMAQTDLPLYLRGLLAKQTIAMCGQRLEPDLVYIILPNTYEMRNEIEKL